MKDYEENYERFWKQILEKDGVLDMDQLKKELADFSFLLEQVPYVYDHVTGGRYSKTSWPASSITRAADEHYEAIYAPDDEDDGYKLNFE